MPFTLIALPAGHVRGRVSRVQLDRSLAILDRAIEFPLSVQGQAAVGDREIVFSIERDRAVEVANCPIVVADLLVKDAPAVESNLVARVSLDDPAVILDSTLIFAFGTERERSTEDAADRLRVEPDDLFVILDRLIVFAFVAKRIGATEIRVGIVGIELKSLLVIADSAVVLMLCIVNGAPVVQGGNVFGVQPNCLAIIFDRAVGLTQFVQVESTAEICGGKIVPLQLR